MNDFLHDRIAFQARLNPGAIAFHESGREIRYARFFADVNAVTRRLWAEGGLARGDRLVVAVQAPYLHWLLLVACSRLGIVTVSVGDSQETGIVKAAAMASDTASNTSPGGPRLLRLSADWIAAQPGPPSEDPRWPKPHQDDLARIVLSSGTTGWPKMIGITYGQLRDRLILCCNSYEIVSRTRTLIGVGMSTLAAFQLPCATWYAGGAVIGTPLQQLMHAWRDGHPTLMMLPPGMLADFMKKAPRGLRPDPSLYLITAGSALPDALNAELRLRLTPSVYNVYGSTEASTVSMCHAADSMRRPGHVGYPVPYADVQVVDEAGAPLGPGQEGALRIRAPGMATQYLDDEEASREAFRGGWFHPGDAARMEPDGSLTITGRVKELANIGGVKIAPERVDELARAVEGVVDAAGFVARSARGDTLCVAVVAGSGFDESVLLSRYRAAFPSHPEPRVVRVERIPRNEMGKVQRGQLAESTTQPAHQQ